MVPFLLFSVVIGRAQQPSPSPDFAEGFKQLAALGMPPLDAKATWSVVAEAANTSNYQLREITKSLKGNAWLLPLADDKSRAIGLGGIEIIELKTAKKHPSEPDLTKDTETILAGLKKLAAKMNADENRDPFGSSNGYGYGGGQNGYGSLLLFSAQLHQTGHPALANRLALAVFEVYPSREAAIDAAVDVLASHFYQQASRAFFASGDWQAYYTALAGLCKRFPRGWSSRDAVAMMLPQLEKQAAGSKAPAPSLPGVTIDPRAIAIIRELTDKPPADPNQKTKDKKSEDLPAAVRYRMQMCEEYGYDGGSPGPPPLWLISAADANADTSAAPQFRLAALKMAAIPALAALTADPFLTQQPNARSYSGYYSSNSSSEDRTLSLYAALNRPATRGEIATRLLAATLPEAQHESDPSQIDPEAIRDAALAFWKDHKDATREELAAVFLREGSTNQSSQAATILATSSDPKAYQSFETHVLSTDPAITSFQVVQTYLRSRKAAARPFFDAYAKLVRSQGSGAGTEDSSNPNAWAVKQAGGAEKILKQLETLVGSQSPRALALQIAKGKPANAQAAINSLSSLLESAPPLKHLHALLEGANAATDATVRARFLAATWRIRWEPGEADDEPSVEASAEEKQGDRAPKKDEPPPGRKISDPEAAVWRKLIADTRSVASQFSSQNRYGDSESDAKPTISEIAACALETSIHPSEYSDTYEAAVILNKSASALFVERATARLSGKPVTPFPDASKIRQERLAEIVAAAGKKPSAEIHPYLATLTPDERAAWLKWMNEPGDLAAPDTVTALQSVIVARHHSDVQDIKGNANLNVGFKITSDTFTKHIESLAPEIDIHSRSYIAIYSADFGPGLQIQAKIAPFPTKNPRNKANPEDDPGTDDGPGANGARNLEPAIRTLDANEGAAAVIMVNLQGEDCQRQAVWLIQDSKATLQPTDADDDDAKEPFATILKNLLESKQPHAFNIQIQILSRADAKKFSSTIDDSSPTTEEKE